MKCFQVREGTFHKVNRLETQRRNANTYIEGSIVDFKTLPCFKPKAKAGVKLKKRILLSGIVCLVSAYNGRGK